MHVHVHVDIIHTAQPKEACVIGVSTLYGGVGFIAGGSTGPASGALFISGPPNTIAHHGLHCCIYALQAMNTSVTFIHPTYAITTCL